MGAKARKAKSMNAAHAPCQTSWWWDTLTGTAIIEAARVVGLAMLPPKKFHPFELDTHGLGVLLATIATKRVDRLVVGIGGSATNDGGFGLARALGWQFLDKKRNPIEKWTGLPALMSLVAPPRAGRFREVVVAVDVQNPLLGRRGASRVYGPQKGLRASDIPIAERCLQRLAIVIRDELGQDLGGLPGAGAAGGLGFAFRAFLGAKLTPGFELFARSAKLEHRLEVADLGLTGEGELDASTLMGKGVGRLAALCQSKGVPCIGLAGIVTTAGKQHRLFTRTPITSAMARPRPIFR
jgi:glycerate kinase